MNDLKKIIEEMDPEQAIAEIAAPVKDIFPLVSEKLRVEFIYALIGDPDSYRLISTEKLWEFFSRNTAKLIIVDTRQEWEFRTGHIKGAVNFPMEPTWWGRWLKKGATRLATDGFSAARQISHSHGANQ